MKVKIIRPNRIERVRAGEIVEVSPNRALFLLRYGMAEPVIIREQIETPEEPKIFKKESKTTRKRTK